MTNNKQRTANSRFAKAGVSCFYDSEVLNSSFVLLMKFSAENPRLRKAANRYASAYESIPIANVFINDRTATATIDIVNLTAIRF